MELAAGSEDFINIASWNRVRTSKELLSYIEKRITSLSPDDDDL